VILVVCFRRRDKMGGLAVFGVFWYFIAMSPKFYARLQYPVMEHHAYFPLIGIYFLLGVGLLNWKRGRRYARELSRHDKTPAFPVSFVRINGCGIPIYRDRQGMEAWWAGLRSAGAKLFRKPLVLASGASFLLVLGLFFIFTAARNLDWRDESTLWQATLKNNPDSSLAKGSLAAIMIARGDFDKAQGYLSGLASSDVVNMAQVSLTNQAMAYAFNNEPQKGLAILEKNRERILKTHAAIYFKALGAVYSKMGKKNEARDAWEQAIRIQPVNAHLKMVLGNWYLEQFADLKRAKQYFIAAINDNPDLPAAYYGLGRVLEDEDPRAAAAKYQKTLELAPDFFDAYYRLGVVYAQKLLDPKAEQYFLQALKLNPKSAEVSYSLGVFYLSLPQPDYQRAKEYLEKARSLGYKIAPEIEKRIGN